MSALLALLALLAIAACLAWLLRRDLIRAERAQRRRAWLRRNPRARELARSLEAMQEQIGAAMLPALQRFARATSDALNRSARS